MKILPAALILSFAFSLSCARLKVWQASDFDGVSRGEGNDLFFGKIVTRVRSGKKPTCRTEIATYRADGVPVSENYELPPDGMVFFWGRQGSTWFSSVSCFRNKNWMPTVAFLEKIPTFQNRGGGKVTYFGTLNVDVPDVDDLPVQMPQGKHHYTATYDIKEEQAEAVDILHEEFPWTQKIPIEKNILVPAVGVE